MADGIGTRACTHKARFNRVAKRIFAAAALSLLAACAQPARVSQMAVTNVIAPVVASNPELVGSMSVGEVAGGKETNPIWTSQVDNPQFREALERSLEFNGLLASGGTPGRFVVTANLIELDQPIMGFNLTVTPRVAYRVVEKSSSNELFREELTTPYTAEFGQSLIAVERLRLANEGAIRESIKRFLTRFGEIWTARTGRAPASAPAPGSTPAPPAKPVS
ncbi:MAG: hypothetical protein GC202_08955 [Alphaproteobacteria bacterium]|nr:hypothetical protein [Alphaproteobacteria bacterium]